jgi:hypothetical protein
MSASDLAEARQHIARAGVFTIGMVPRNREFGPEESLPSHTTILRPVLTVATDCWVYDLKPRGAVYKSAAGILQPEKGRFRVRLEGDPISGRELFWNADSGRCGTIVILVPVDRFPAEKVFRACNGVWVFMNFLAGHTPAATRYARTQVDSGKFIAACLPRNNGIEWLDLFAEPQLALKLFNLARRVRSRKPKRSSGKRR